jgi:hypothetical protein
VMAGGSAGPKGGASLRRRLSQCPPGDAGWREFEDAALAVLCHLLVPPLMAPIVQARTLSGLDRRDAIFSNRITDTRDTWGLLRHDHDARLIPVEFKNYDKRRIGKDEVDQTRNYLKRSMGRLAIVCCNKPPDQSAYLRRNGVYSEEGKVILFLTSANLIEMLNMKERGSDPSAFILDYVDLFLVQHE